jgi:hypothetical protein
VPYLLALERIDPNKLLAKETPDQVLEVDGARAILRHGDACNALISAKTQYANKSVNGAASKSLTPGEAWPGARCKHLEVLDVSNAHPCH